MTPDGQLELAAGVDPVELIDDVDVIETTLTGDALVIPSPIDAELVRRNLFGEADRIAARAASASARRQYAAIYRAFAHWLREQLGRPPIVGDLDADVIAAYARHLATGGGRGGRPAAPATARVYVSMVRALVRQLGREDAIADVRAPRHEAGPPEALTDADYANLVRVPDRRSLAGKRDYALLRVLGDCGLRSAELRGLRARDLRRPRTNARHFRLFVRGKGGREREVPVPEAVQQALEAWMKVHPLARGGAARRGSVVCAPGPPHPGGAGRAVGRCGLPAGPSSCRWGRHRGAAGSPSRVACLLGDPPARIWGCGA